MTPHKPDRTEGLAHMVAATGYSAAGLLRLWQEASFRQEVLGGIFGLIVLLGAGVPAQSLAISVLLLLSLLAVEAMNTAIEVIVDHLSPDWSAFGKQAKDLGSAAVLLMILVNVIWFGITLSNILFYYD